MLERISEVAGKALAQYLTREIAEYKKFSAHRLETLAEVMQPGDVLLVEGDLRVSSAIKFLTQSNWSHAALYVGDMAVADTVKNANIATGGLKLIEADLEQGVIAVPLEKYAGFNTRICRPYKLQEGDQQQLCQFMIDSLGMQYDLKNVTDLARFLIPKPPVPQRWRRKMLALGSADPTRAICSSLIARAFHSIGYPILPDVFSCAVNDTREEILHIRHHSLFAPKDFDVSPYFEVIKPTLVSEFDYKKINWHQHSKDFWATGESDFDCTLCRNHHDH